MKSNAHYHPTSFTKTHGKLWFNKNIVETTITDEVTGKTRPWFEYDQIEVAPENETEIMMQSQDGKYVKEFRASKEHHFKNFKAKVKEAVSF